MTWRILHTSRARRSVRRLHSIASGRIIAALDRLATTHHGDVARVHGHTARWRLRVGDWRVFFTYETTDRAIVVLDVRHRREAYRAE